MKKIVVLLALFVGFFTCDGQDILINSTNNGQTIQGCSGIIYDSGGNIVTGKQIGRAHV